MAGTMDLATVTATQLGHSHHRGHSRAASVRPRSGQLVYVYHQKVLCKPNFILHLFAETSWGSLAAWSWSPATLPTDLTAAACRGRRGRAPVCRGEASWLLTWYLVPHLAHLLPALSHGQNVVWSSGLEWSSGHRAFSLIQCIFLCPLSIWQIQNLTKYVTVTVEHIIRVENMNFLFWIWRPLWIYNAHTFSNPNCKLSINCEVLMSAILQPDKISFQERKNIYFMTLWVYFVD